MRSIEDSGLGATTPVLAQPGRTAVSRMLYHGGTKYPSMPAPRRPMDMFVRATGLQTCDADGSGGIICQEATPASAMNGLSGLGQLGAVTWSNAFCRTYDSALQNLQILVTEAERVGLVDTVEYLQAKALIDDETSYAQWKHATPVLPETCTKETLKAESLYTALNEAVKGAGGSRGVDLALPSESAPDNKTSDTIKVVAVVAGITVAVGGIVYLVGPLVRGLSKAGARRLR